MYIVSTVIVIFPNALDNWNTYPPFENDPLGTTNAYVLANTDKFDPDFLLEYTVLSNRLLTIGKIGNKIDFMQKTLTDSTERNVTEGIGGLAKLKDFQFTIIDKDDLNIANSYGRKIEIRLYEGNILEPDIADSFIVKFKGIIFKSVSNDLYSVKLYVQGTIANNNPRIKGIPYINSDGDTANSVIIIGDSTKTKVKLDKKMGQFGVQLGFNSSQYELEKIYIKDKEYDEFYTVTSDYNVVGDDINFDSGNFTQLTYNISGVKKDSKLCINDGIDFIFLIEPEDYKTWLVIVRPYGNIKFTHWLYKIKTYVKNSKTYGIYRASPSLRYQELWEETIAYFENGALCPTDRQDSFDTSNLLNSKLKSWSIKSDEILTLSRLITVYDQTLENKLKLVYYGEQYIRENLDCTILPVEKKDLSIIQIDNEKMLVLKADDNYSMGMRECTVVRGYLDTEIVYHLAGAPITVLGSEETQKPKIHIKKKLSDIYQSDSPGYTEDYEKSPYDWVINKTETQKKSMLYMDLRLPDISGTLRTMYIKSVMDWKVFDNLEKQTILAVNLAMTEFPNWYAIPDSSKSKKIFSRQMVGYNQENLHRAGLKRGYEMHGKTYQSDISFGLSTDVGMPYLMYGRNTVVGGIQTYNTYKEAVQDLKGGWNSYIEGDYLISYFRRWGEWEGSTFNIIEYEELKKVHFALVANFYNCNLVRQYHIYIHSLSLNVKLNVPIADNDWYGRMKNLSDGSTQGTLVDSFSIGTNGSIYVTDDFKYIFAESDTIPFMVFSLSKTGMLSELQRVSIPDYNDIVNGELVLLDGDKVAKMSVHATEYKWVESVYFSHPNFPSFTLEIKDSSNVSKIIIGSNTFDVGNFIISYVDSTIEVWKKGEVANGNPVNVLKSFLINYAKHPSSIIDDDGTLDSSFHRVRLSRRKQRCTVVIEQEVNANVIIDKLCKNYGLVLYENNIGMLSLADLYPPKESQVFITLEDENILLHDKTNQPEIKRTHIDIRYLITDLNVRYRPLGDKFQKEILSTNLPGNLKERLNKAKSYTDNNTELVYHHMSTADKKTALYCALIKLYYHCKPTQLLKLKVRIDWATMDVCSWIKINSSYISSAGKIYLVISNMNMLPLGTAQSYSEIELFEYNWDEISNYIQEVYTENENAIYDEVFSSTDQIQEKY